MQMNEHRMHAHLSTHSWQCQDKLVILSHGILMKVRSAVHGTHKELFGHSSPFYQLLEPGLIFILSALIYIVC